MRPTLRCVLVFAAGFPIAIVTVAASPGLWTLWLAYIGAVAVLAGIDAVLALPWRLVRIGIAVPDTLYIGDRDTAVITLEARGYKRPVAMELLADLDDNLARHRPAPFTLPANKQARVEVPLVPRRRGEMTVEALWLRWTGPFGLIGRQHRHPVAQSVSVIPDVRAVRGAALRFLSSRDLLYGRKIERYVGDGSEFESLCEYVPGLDHRAIDWKASARHNTLLCREFRAERNHQVIIAIDTGQLMSELVAGVPKVDHAINAGLILGYLCLRTGDRVGLLGFDSRVRACVAPAGGMRAFRHLEKQSAALGYSHEETNFTLGLAELASRLRRRSLVVLLTDVVDTITAELMMDNVDRLARRHLVILVTLRDPDLTAVATEPGSLPDLYRAAVASDFVREREVVIRRLERLGVHCIDVPPRAVSMRLVNRYLDIKRRELL